MEDVNVNPQAADVVRIVTTVGGGSPRAVYAIVLNRSIAEEETIGANGEPTLSVVFLEPGTASEKILSGPDFAKALHRFGGIPHVSAKAVAERRHSIYWTDLLPAAGGYSELQPIKVEHSPEPVAPRGIVMLEDFRTAYQIQTDGKGAFIIVKPEGTAVSVEEGTPAAPSARERRFSTVEDADRFIDEMPDPVIPPGANSNLPGVVTEHGDTLPPKPEDVTEASGELGSSESLIGREEEPQKDDDEKEVDSSETQGAE